MMSEQQPNSYTSSRSTPSEAEAGDYLPVGVVAIAFIVLVLVFFGYKGDNAPSSLGATGDWFGGLLNPLIAFLALFGLIRSISIQRETLRKTTQGLEDQINLQRKQASRQTFFDLLTLRAGAVNSIAWREADEPVIGRSATKAILKTLADGARDLTAEEVQEDLNAWEVPTNRPNSAAPYIALFAAYYSGNPLSFAAVWKHHLSIESADSSLDNLESELGHVFRATFQVLKFVHQCPDFDDTEKQDLANYLRAQMSEDEFVLFALTALTSIGRKSRAVAIAFDLYEDRLYSVPWAKELRPLFERSNPENQRFAAELGYAVIAPRRSPC